MNLLIFQNDLRLHDNQAFYDACKSQDELLAVYILDDDLFKDTTFCFPRADKTRLNFLYQSLRDLEESFLEQGSKLHIVKGNWKEIISFLKSKFEFKKIFMTNELSYEEQEKILFVKQVFIESDLLLYQDNSLYGDLKINLNQIPSSFTKFRKIVENELTVLNANIESYKIPCLNLDLVELETITAKQLLEKLDFEPDPRSAFLFSGGESSGLARLFYYLEESKKITSYKETRNGLLGMDYSSKFSAWLANGSLSVRYLYQQIEKFEHEFTKNESTYWLKFELLWREYFRKIYLRFKEKFFLQNGMNGLQNSTNIDGFEFWANAKTKNNFVNAFMTELNLTGFMSNRGRQNVASYLVHNLGLNWRIGSAYFESKLIDYDVYSNWGNWQYIAGLGATNQSHIFDIDAQARFYDAKNEFRDYWLC